MSVATPPESEMLDRHEKRLRLSRDSITFYENGLEGTSQPHDDTLVVTSQIKGFLVKMVMIDQGSKAKIMYLDVYKGLGLKPEDLTKYYTPLVGIDEKIMVLEGQIKLPILTKGKEVMVSFIMVNAFSPYMTILGRPWIHAMEAVPFMLHLKVKFLIKDGIIIVRVD